MLETKHHPNRLGLWGWLGGGRYGLERYLYLLHRVTGLGILFYFVLHIGVTSFRVLQPERWNEIMEIMHKPIFLIGEYLVYVAFAFHALNGIRLALLELGFGVGKPIEPVYPYRTSVNVQRPMAVVVMLLAAVVVVLGGLDLPWSRS